MTSTIQPHVGGTYHHEMTIRDVGVHPIRGKLLAYDTPKHLAYEMPGMTPESVMRVDIRFTEVAGGTQVVLTQQKVPHGLKDVVASGWTASFERLARFFEGERRPAAA